MQSVYQRFSAFARRRIPFRPIPHFALYIVNYEPLSPFFVHSTVSRGVLWDSIAQDPFGRANKVRRRLTVSEKTGYNNGDDAAGE